MIALTVVMTAENRDKTSDRHPDPKLEADQLRSASRALASGAFVMVGAVLAGLGMGYVIDRAAGTSPTWTMIMLGVFILGGFYNLYREAGK